MKFPPERFDVFFANLTNSHHPEVDPTTLPFASEDQSPISEPEPHTSVVAPTQDQAETTSVYDTPFEEAVPLEDELASLLDDIDD